MRGSSETYWRMTKNDYKDREEEGVEELRHRLKGAMSPEKFADKGMFLRFLRARNHDINAAENMLRNHLNWRKLTKADTILQWYTPHEVSRKYLPFTKLGFDHEGSCITYLAFGTADIRGLVKSIKISEVSNFIINLLEEDLVSLKRQSEKLNREVEEWIHVLNFENFPLSVATHKPSIEAIGKIIALYEANYPERLKMAIVINASWYFQIGYACIKPLISGNTLKKIKIYGKDGWQDELRQLINVDELPAFLGGNKTDPDGDPLCRTFINQGGQIPESYFAENIRVPLAGQPGVKKLSIGRLSKVQVELHVLFPGSDIEWEFETKGKDVAFTLLYKESKFSNMEPKELFMKQRIDTNISAEVGIFKTEKAGAYYLEFDNSYSWFQHKEVYYRVKVTSPQKICNG